jgi:amino acid transporter
MNTLVSIIVNIGLIALFVYIIKKENFLSFFQGGRWWLTWLAVGIITLMDEITSIFYAHAEAYLAIGSKAIIYIALTSILIRFLSTRMVEISEILEVNGLRGGGVYSFSYLVLGPSASFIAVSSILVDYVLTAVLSTVSAVNNGTSFLGIGTGTRYLIMFAVIWGITFLNILGIKENAKFTFGVFVLVAFVLTNLILGGILSFDSGSVTKLGAGFGSFLDDFKSGNIFNSYYLMIMGIGSCILAYSGIESVLQTASLVKSWKDIRRAYLFLALTVGIITPLVGLLAMSSKIDVHAHSEDFITQFGALVHGPLFGILVGGIASIALIMAVNTAMVASAELIEKIAEKYNYLSLIALNKRQSLYRIHILNATFYSFILVLTGGVQNTLAHMYAVGLVASFCINTFALIKYRYSRGTKEITYHTSRIGTILLFIVLASTFLYIFTHKTEGAVLWLIVTVIVLIGGLWMYRKRSPEIPRRKLTHSPMDIIFAIAESTSNKVNIFFRRPNEKDFNNVGENSIYISFYTPRLEEPSATVSNHFWLSIQKRMSLFDMIYGLLDTLQYEVEPDKKLTLHFGWPSSSWIDRISIGFMIFRLMRLPKRFPKFNFVIEYLEENRIPK